MMKHVTIFQLVLLCILTSSIQAFSQCNSLICEPTVSIAADANCEVTLTLTDLLDPATDCPGSKNIMASIGGMTIATATDVLTIGVSAYIGQTITVDVEDVATMTSCQSMLTPSDATNPTATCPANVTTCVDVVPGAYGAYGTATGDDNCGSVNISVVETSATMNSQTVVTREFTVEDNSSNTASCTQTLTFNLNPVLEAPSVVQICEGGSFDFAALPLTDLNQTGGTISYHSATPTTAGNELGSSVVSPMTSTIYYVRVETAEGCADEVAVTVEIATSSTLACNASVQVSLDEDCLVELTPDMILEGDYFYPLYTVEITNGIGQSFGNILDNTHVGETLIVKVTEPCFENSCWGSVTVEDKLPPVIQCGPPINLGCLDDISQAQPPIAIDNCEGIVPVQLTSETIIEDDLCDNDTILVERSWIAFDSHLNQSAPCKDTIVITTSFGVSFPDDIFVSCEDYAADPSIIDAAIAGAGGINTTGNICNVFASVEEETVPICGSLESGFKIIRTWTVLDWCSGQIITTGSNGNDNVQIIKVEDTTPPVITANDLTVGTNIPATHPQICRSTGFIPPALVDDNCNGWTLRIFTPVGEVVYLNGTDGLAGGNIPYPGLPIGNYTIQYQAEDDCGNVSTLDVNLTVADNTPPIVICKDDAGVSISSQGSIPVIADFFVEDSYDDCCLDDLLVSRTGLPGTFAPFANFSCEDAFNSPITVYIQAIDCAGNISNCSLPVDITYGFTPSIACPPDATIDCDTYVENYEGGLLAGDYSVLAPFGGINFGEDCGNMPDDMVTVTLNIDQCKSGTIVRTFELSSNGNSASCDQIITVEHVSDFEVRFPDDGAVACDEDLPEFGAPELFFDECEMIATSFEDVIFSSTSGACYKIVRNWKVINWCTAGDFDFDDVIVDPQPDPINDPRRFRDGGDGVITGSQTIEVNDDQAPVITSSCEDIIVSINNGCFGTVELPTVTVEDDCGTNPDVTVTTDLGSGTGPFTNVDPGSYTVVVQASDNCGNVSSCSYEILVVDNKNPTPYCLDGLVVELMNTTPPMIELWAVDFDAGSFDACGENISIAFDPIGTTNATFDCDDIGQQTVEIWVTDESGNQDFCTTFVIIQDNMNNCMDPQVQVTGNVATETNQPLENVEIDLNGGMSAFGMTDAYGNFDFEIEEGTDITINPHKDDDALNGVTTFDLVLISKHVLGSQLLDSPYKMIAADANNSGSITTLDLVTLRKLILNIDENLTNNTSWRFVEKDFEFPNPQNPWQTTFPELINLNNVPADVSDIDFVSIKIGDVNGNAATNNLIGTDDRNYEESLIFSIENEQLVENEMYTLEFTAADFDHLGFQFTLNFDKNFLDFQTIEERIAQEENFGLSLLEEGIITVSWNDAQAVKAADKSIFSLSFIAKKAGNLQGKLWIGSAITPAEAYAANGNLNNVELQIGSSSNEFELYQNQPNPFTEETTISFYLPTNETVTINIIDEFGKTVKNIKRDFVKGYNEINLSKDDVKATGTYYYQLITDSKMQTRKMVFIQ